jgi:small subunit ribosomal protein S5
MARRDTDSGLREEVIEIRFPNKVTKGGRTLSVAALVAVGDGNGRVGLGYGKARGVPQAIEKANKEARSNMIDVHLVGDTIAHEVVGKQTSARVMLKPASPGTGVKAGATVRSILQALGVRNVLTKVYGSRNAVNVAKATMKALGGMRSAEEVSALRGVPVQLHHPQAEKEPEEPAEQPEAEPADLREETTESA